MRKQTIFVAVAMALSLQASAQTKGGGISQEMLLKMQQEQKFTAADNAVANAIAANAIDDLAKNRKAAADIELEKKKAINDAKNEISGLALAIAGKVVGRELNTADQTDLIDRFIDELGEGV